MPIGTVEQILNKAVAAARTFNYWLTFRFVHWLLLARDLSTFRAPFSVYGTEKIPEIPLIAFCRNRNCVIRSGIADTAMSRLEQTHFICGRLLITQRTSKTCTKMSLHSAMRTKTVILIVLCEKHSRSSQNRVGTRLKWAVNEKRKEKIWMFAEETYQLI